MTSQGPWLSRKALGQMTDAALFHMERTVGGVNAGRAAREIRKRKAAGTWGFR